MNPAESTKPENAPTAPTAARPPRLAASLVRAMLAHSPYGRAAGGDLDEGFDQLAATSALRATFWYWRRALSIAMHYLPSLLASTADHLVHDGAYAARALRRTPLFTIVATVILALGIGANTAVLGLIDDMYFRKLPVPQPERIVAIYAGDTRNRGRAGTLRDESISLHTFAELRTRIRGVDTLAMYAVHSLPTGDPLSGDETWSALVSGNYFHVLGVAPERGRFIGDDDEQPEGAHPVVVISDYLWREKFAGDEHVIGRQIPIGQVTFTVIGVAPRGFTGLHPEGRTILWMPYTMANALAPRGTASHAPATGSQDTFFGTVFGRLSANATLAQVQASADGAAQDLTANDLTANRHLAFYVRVRDRLTTAELSGNALSMFALAWIMIALLHLVACSNVASLMLARSAARRRELGVRMCLGASRMRILMQSFIEAWLLAILGAGGGLAVGLVFSKLLARMAFLSASNPHLDLRVIAIVALVVGATVVQFGMLPAFDASRTDPLSVLRGGPGRARGVRRDRSEMVVLGQVAVSMTLVANAAVFVALARRQATTSPGYDAAHLAVASVSLRDGLVSPSDQHAAYADALTRVAAVPGVRAATGAVGAPLFNTHWFGAVSTPTSVATSDGASQTSLQAVGPGYFATLGAPLVRGREFTIRDRLPPTAPRDAFDVVVVNESLARRLWPNDDPIGKQISVPGSSSAIVVGIVRDIHDVSTIAAVPRAYVPLLETRFQSFDVVVRTTGPASISVETIRAALQASGELQRPAVRTMSFIQAGAMSTSRAAALGVSICGGLALFLTVVGLYGIVTMWAAQRRAEIGIRLALGATSGNVHWLLLSGVGKLLCTGAALGLFCAFGIVQIERGQIGPIISLDAAAVGISLLVLVACAGAAAYLPSRRATRQHPAEVLRTSI